LTDIEASLAQTRYLAYDRLTSAARAAVEAEAAALPLPGLEREIEVAWSA